MKIRYYIVSLFALLSITSCSDFLDLTPISEASSANYYKNTSDINSALTACYGSLQGTYQYGEYFIALMELRSDNVEDINPGGAAGVFYFIDNFTVTSGNNIIRQAWKELYNQIYRCNCSTLCVLFALMVSLPMKMCVADMCTIASVWLPLLIR